MSEWLKEMGCKPIGYAYAGSNPAPPISVGCLPVGRRANRVRAVAAAVVSAYARIRLGRDAAQGIRMHTPGAGRVCAGAALGLVLLLALPASGLAAGPAV